MAIHKSGCESLQYEFRFNASENRIELQYSFLSGVPEEQGTILDISPVSRVLTMDRKQRGRKPEIDRIFDDPQKMREVTEGAEAHLSKELGWVIDRAIQLLFYEVLYRSGLPWRRGAVDIKEALTRSFKQSLRDGLAIKEGRPGTWRNANHYKQTMETIKNTLLRAGEHLTQENFAAEITEQPGFQHKSNKVIDVRAIRQWNKDYGLAWRAFKAESK